MSVVVREFKKQIDSRGMESDGNGWDGCKAQTSQNHQRIHQRHTFEMLQKNTVNNSNWALKFQVTELYFICSDIQ